MTGYRYRRNKKICTNCRFCITGVSCPSPQYCVGCGACYLACPNEAMHPTDVESEDHITIKVDGQIFEVPNGVTVKVALESLGIVFSRFPESTHLFAPCETGGCYACAVLIKNELRPSCHTAVKAGQEIITHVSDNIRLLRIVGWCQPHSVGGVGTPWSAKALDGFDGRYVEVACFAAGCNLRCRTCQNFSVTYNSAGHAVTPEQAAERLLKHALSVGIKRLAISGGEATLNRPWLLEFFTWLMKNSSSDYRLHLDTNATILTPNYIDALVDAGITDIGPDVKAARLETFQVITGIVDSVLAQQYLDSEWSTVKYITDNYYPEKMFMGVGLPFNPAFYVSSDAMLAEIHEWGTQIADIDDQIQVTVLDYRPEFRRYDINRPSIEEMRAIKAKLEGIGLRSVVVQTASGHLPPSG